MSQEKSFNLRIRDLGKRYNREWIFRDLSTEWSSGQCIGIGGTNGSGKSTLLRVLSGFESPSKGDIVYTYASEKVSRDNLYNLLSLAAPYTELIEELTMQELVDFHFSFKSYLPKWDKAKLMGYVGLGKAAHRPLNEFSSGMKQRVKLATALISDTPLVFLDEPTTNLDDQGKAWFQELLASTASHRLIFIASNETTDFAQCDDHLSIIEYKN